MQTYIDCLHLKKTDKSRMNAEDPMEVENGASTNDEDIPHDYEDKAIILLYLSSQPCIFMKYLTSEIVLKILGWEIERAIKKAWYIREVN